MATLIRKCANPRCSDIIGTSERKNKMFCSQECKTRAHNESQKKGQVTWNKILEKYNQYLEEKGSLSFSYWLQKKYYPPRIIKQKK